MSDEEESYKKLKDVSKEIEEARKEKEDASKKIEEYRKKEEEARNKLEEERERKKFEEFKKKEERERKKFEELKKKEEEREKKLINEYNEKRIDIKNIFLPKKYENNTYYDVIIKMNSLRELLFDGWEICCSNKYENYKNNPYIRSVPISIIGEGNSGKSFLLERIFNVELPNGFSQKTEGISVKYLDNGEFALIDTCGLRKSINKNDKNQLKK